MLGGILMPLICCILGYIIGWLTRAQKKVQCKNHEDCKYACYKGRCEPCAFLPSPIRLAAGEAVCPLQKEDVLARALKAASTAQAEAAALKQAIQAPSPMETPSTLFPGTGWTKQDEIDAAAIDGDPTNMTAAEYAQQDALVKARAAA